MRDLLRRHCHPLHRLKAAQYSFPHGRRFKESAARQLETPGLTAVVLGCETGVPPGTSRLARGLLRVTALDFFSGEVLLDGLATPAQKIADYRTEVHGITAADLAAAERAGRALSGFGAARAELAKLVDSETILVGHGLGDALRVLRLAHSRVLDTAILVADAALGFAPAHAKFYGLPRLDRELLGFDGPAAPDLPHSTREDLLVTRELALWCLRHPWELSDWATDAQRKFYMGL